MLAVLGCQERDWQKTYFEAEEKFRSGNSDSALALAKAGYRHFENSDPLWHWKFRVLTAEILLRNHPPEQALALLEPAPEHELPQEILARKYIVGAQALCKVKKSNDSQRLFDQAAQLIRADEPKLRAELELALGNCAFSTDRTLALRHFEASARSAHGVDDYAEARALGAAGFTLLTDGLFEKAKQKLLLASSITAITGSPLLQEGLLGDLGECYEQLGDWKTAIDYSEKAEKLASGIKDAASDRARWLIDLGREYYSQLKYADAQGALTKALEIATRLNDKDLQARCLDNLAALALAIGDHRGAERYVKADIEVNPAGEQRLYLLLCRAELAKRGGDLSSAEHFLRQVLDPKPEERIAWQAQSALASIYTEEQKFDLAEEYYRASISSADKVFVGLTDDSSRISFLDYHAFYDGFVRFLIKQNRQAEALSIAERGRSRALAAALGLTSEQGLNIRAIQDRLKNRNQVALAYWLSPNESYLWIITPAQIELRTLAPEAEIVKAIDTYSENLRYLETPEESGLGQRLYEMLVAPAEKYVRKYPNVIIVPHRRLYKLNFETLVSPHPEPHFWIKDVCIQNISFLAVLEKPARVVPHYPKDLLLIGAPIEASKEFPVLAHAPEEMEKISAHFGPAKKTVIEGKQATPGAYAYNNPRQFHFVHFVTHGTASDMDPLDSAIILSRSIPSLPSGDDFKLKASEIVKTKIHPELVTISACYGAGTRQYSGEGLVGLAWAFMRVGAHQVVAALWEVDDAANADLMDQFYAELTKGKTAATALRDGKLAMLHSRGPRKQPYYWASLQLYTGP